MCTVHGVESPSGQEVQRNIWEQVDVVLCTNITMYYSDSIPCNVIN